MGSKRPIRGAQFLKRKSSSALANGLPISMVSSAYAAAVVKTILNATRNLSRFPFAGRVVPELADENIREWFAYSYRVIIGLKIMWLRSQL